MPVFDLPTPEGWKAELILMVGVYRDGLPVPDSQPSEY